MREMTIGGWLLAVAAKQSFDLQPRIQQLHARGSVGTCECQDCLEEGRLETRIHAEWVNAWYGPGMADLRALAQSEGEAEGVSESWLLKKRGQLVASGGWTAGQVDALTIPQFVKAIRVPVVNGKQTTETAGDPPDCYVTLLQIAAIVNRNKRTLRRLHDGGKLPAPAIQGAGGKPNEWRWNDVRPILENEFDKMLPLIFPADQFVRA